MRLGVGPYSRHRLLGSLRSRVWSGVMEVIKAKLFEGGSPLIPLGRRRKVLPQGSAVS